MKHCDMWKHQDAGGPPHTRCRKTARVMVKLEINTNGGGKTELTTLRCWHHYLALEETARQPYAYFAVLGAILYGPNEQKEPAHGQPAE